MYTSDKMAFIVMTFQFISQVLHTSMQTELIFTSRQVRAFAIGQSQRLGQEYESLSPLHLAVY